MKKRIKIFVCFCVVLIFFTVALGDGLAKCPVRMGSLYIPDHFSVIARAGSVSEFPENTLPAFQEALDIDGANALAVDLFLTRDGKVILWRAWNNPGARRPIEKFKPSGPSSKVPAFQDFMDWATQQNKLKLVLFKLRIPAHESSLATILLEEIRRVMDDISPAPRFQFVFLTPHKEILNRVKNQFKDFSFSYDREIPSVEIINYHSYTTVPNAMEFKNSFASIGFPNRNRLSVPLAPDAWDIYKFILTLDFKIRDNYKRSTSNYIKIISWAFNDESKMRCLIHLGVDGIVTNNPKLLRKIALDMGKVLD